MMSPSVKPKAPAAGSSDEASKPNEHRPIGTRARAAAKAKAEAERKESPSHGHPHVQRSRCRKPHQLRIFRASRLSRRNDCRIHSRQEPHLLRDKLCPAKSSATATANRTTADHRPNAPHPLPGLRIQQPRSPPSKRESAPTLTKAIQVFNDYHLAMQNPLIAASERGSRAQKAAHENDDPRQPPPEPSCKGCNRTFSTAQADHERINRDATSGRTSLDIAEEHALQEFQGIKCPECWMWRAHAPILVMRERLRELGRGDEKIATPEPIPSTHPPAGSGTNADGERNTHRGPAT